MIGIYKAIEESNKIYSRADGKDQARSSDKLYPLHQEIGNECKSRLDEKDKDRYGICGLGHEEFSNGEITILGKSYPKGKEHKVEGLYYSKKGDVSIIDGKDELVKDVILVKSPQSSFGKNTTNYIDHILGETYNLRRNNITVGQFLVLQTEIPRYDKNKEITGYDNVSYSDLEPYIKINNDVENQGRPDAMCVLVVKISSDGTVSKASNIPGCNDRVSIENYNKISDPDRFFKEFTECLTKKK